MSGSPYSVYIPGRPASDIDEIQQILAARGDFVLTNGGFLQASSRERIWLEIEPMDDGLVIDVFPISEPRARPIAHAVVDALEAAGVSGAIVFLEDPDFPDARPTAT